MKTFFKKSTALLIVFTMLLASFPLQIFAAEQCTITDFLGYLRRGESEPQYFNITDFPAVELVLMDYDVATDTVGEILDTTTTASDGSYAFSIHENDPEDAFYVIDIAAGQPYVLNFRNSGDALPAPGGGYIFPGAYTGNVSSGLAKELYISIDESYFGEVSLTKYALASGGGLGETLAGVSFGLYDGDTDAYLGSYTTDANGNITIELEIGSYYFVETMSLEGYEYDASPIHFNIASSGLAELNVTNTPYPSITIQKTDADTGELITGAILNVYRVGTSSPIYISNPANSSFTLSLAPGSYYITEAQAPTNYTASNAQIPFEVVSNTDDIISFPNEKITTSIDISKLRSDNDTYLAGATLSINGPVSETWVSGNSAHTISGLVPGTYTLSEDIVPTGFFGAIGGTIIIGENCATITYIQNGVPTDITTSRSIELYNAPEVISVSVEKVWDDNNDQDGKRPEEITVNLMNGNTVVGTATLSATNGWTCTFSNVLKYENGSLVNYTVKEVLPAGSEYSSDITGDITGGFVITNSYEPQTVDVAGIKIWEDNENSDGKRPASITVNLLANGVKVADTEVSEATSWMYSFSDLPAFANGTPITYTIEETSIPFYTSQVSGFNIINTYAPENVSISGAKVWDDDNNRDGKRPASITIRLYADGVEIDSQTVNSASGWTWDFGSLPKYRNGGVEIVYSINEDAVAGYTATVNGFNVVNSYTPETTSITINKVWDDNNDQDGIRPDSIQVMLYANGTLIQTVELSATNGYEAVVGDLPAYSNGTPIEYTISESPINGYTSSINGFTITNAHVPATVILTIQKVWDDDNNRDGKRPASITVDVYRNGVRQSAVSLKESGKWSKTIKNLPKYENGELIEYTIKEILPDGSEYTPSYDEYIITNTYVPEKITVSVNKIWEDNDNSDRKRPDSITINLLANGVVIDSKVMPEGVLDIEFTDLYKYENGAEIQYTITEDAVPEYASRIWGNMYDGYHVVNSYENITVRVAGSKTWLDNNDQDGMRPESITIHLYDINDKLLATKVVTAADGWAWDFGEYPKFVNGEEMFYYLDEEPVPGYADNQLGLMQFDITNTHSIEKTVVRGQKTWVDDGNINNLRPASITVILYANGVEVASTTTSQADFWRYEFLGLDKYKNGEEIVYTIGEEPVESYETTINGFDITNTYVPETITISGQKIWVDNDNQDGKRPEFIIISLVDVNSSTLVGYLTVTADTNWEYSFNDIPKYINGQEANYKLNERPVANYNTTYDGYNIINTYTTEKLTISGQKTWIDDNNRDGIRPATITIELYANGSLVATTTTSEAEGWAYSFTGLDAYVGGRKISYEVKEQPVAGYDVLYNGYNIVNTHTPEKITITGHKYWDDNNNQDNLRPDNVIISLYANGVEVSTTLARAEADWTYTFNNVNKYENGVEITYTVKEKRVIEGYTSVVNGFDITNIHTPDTLAISGNKYWEDDNNRDGIRPTSVEIILSANGVEIARTTATASNGWKYSFSNLPKFANGTEIAYTVSEVVPAGYTSSLNEYNFTNTHTPEKIDINGNKIWLDEENRDGFRPTFVTIQLLANDIVVATKEVSANDGWAFTFEGVYKYENGVEINYTVKELALDMPEGYTSRVEGFNIFNSWTPFMTNVSGIKTWVDDDNRDGKRPESITVVLYANGVEIARKDVTAADGWSYNFGRVYKNENGQRIVYTVEEILPAGSPYVPTYDGLNITNTYTPEKTTISGSKIWNDDNDRDGLRPVSVVIKLMANGVEVASTLATAENGWTYKFENLDKYANGTEITYTVAEIETAGYTSNVDGFVITNTHIPATINVSGSKIWADENNKDGKRPTNIIVILKANGTEVARKTVSEGDGWTFNFENVYEFDGGNKIVYTVEEVLPAGSPYTPSYNGFIITNAYTPEKIVVNGNKVWEDDNNRDGKRPTSVTIILYANEVEIRRQTILASDNWEFSFANLDKYENGVEIKYTVDELPVEGYSKTVNGFTITNTYTPATTSVSGTKVWSDDNNRDGIRPASVVVILKANGAEVARKEVSAADGWAFTFENLAKYENGTEIQYTIDEEPVEGYITSIDGYTITNSHLPTAITIPVSKVWEDNNNRDGLRPGSITIRLYANGVECGTLTLSAANDWSDRFHALNKYENGVEIVYTISEDAVAGYEANISGNHNIGFEITNTHSSETITVNGTKTWDDDNDRDGLRPDSIIIILKANGTEVARKTITAADNWKYSFGPLNAYENGAKINYTIAEEAVEGYTTIVDNDSYDIVNSHIIHKQDITVTKIWNDEDDRDGKRPDHIDITLYANGKAVATATITAADNWTYVFEDCVVNENGSAIKYTLTEKEVDEYDNVINEETFEVTNTHVAEKISIKGSKIWNDDNDRDGIRPDSVKVELYANGTLVDSITVNAESNWIYEFKDLYKYENGKEITYTVKEVGLPAGYTSSIDGYTITNTHIPATTVISGTKVWVDGNDCDGLRPGKISITLLANGQPVANTVISADDNWAFKFTGLYANENGKSIKYSVAEEAVDGYTTTITGDATNGFVITNTHMPSTTTVSGTKIWNDDNNRDGIRPASITVILYANEVEVARKVVSAADGWAFTFEGLNKYNNGVEIKYTVDELPVAGYTTTINRYTITNTHTPETVVISGTKTWNDDNNRDGIRPRTVTVKLYADGELVETKVVSANDGWAFSFEGYKYNNGKEIAYTIKEADYAPYSSTINGYNIVNTYTPSKISVVGTKVWEDDNDRDGIRPASITLLLKADGVVVAQKTITAADNWTCSFDGLYEYRNGGIEINYTIEEVAVDNYNGTANNNGNGFVIVNTHTPETITISGKKTWIDNNNRDGIRPVSVIVRLYANGREIASTVVTSANDWTYSFNNLYKYENGRAITYTVSEDAVDGYVSTVDGFNITNTHSPTMTAIYGSKTWDDDDNRDGIRPDSVIVRLYANGIEIINTVVSADTNWTYCFTGLYRYAGGYPIYYSISEDPVEGYETEIVGHNIINTHEPELITIEGEKAWDDDNDRDGLRPSSVNINLYANGVHVETVKATAANNWEFEFTDLYRYENGSEIVYTVSEQDVEGYMATITGSADTGFVITNTHMTFTVEIRGEKIWDDDNDRDGLRPENVVIILLADNVAVDKTYASAATNWTFKFTNLPAYENGSAIEYTIAEVGAEGYATIIDGYTITNTHNPETFTISGEKIWVDEENRDGKRPASVIIRLHANGVEIGMAEVSAETNWTYTFSDLYKYENGELVIYTLTEDPVDGYNTVIDGDNVVNFHDPEKTEIAIEKVWVDDDNRDGKRPESVNVKLYANGIEIGTFTIKAEENWKMNITGLYKYENGSEIVYTIDEEAIKNYVSSIDGFVITNTYATEAVSVEGIKIWDDGNNCDGIRPDSVIVRLYANGVEIAHTTVSAETNWAYKFDNLHKFENGAEIVYTVSEDAVEGYTTTINGYAIINVHMPETITISGSKIWVDENNKDNKRPETITVRLYANGVEVDAISISTNENKEFAFANLPKYENGIEIVYTIAEDEIVGYHATIDGFVITNTYIPAPPTGDVIIALQYALVAVVACLAIGYVVHKKEQE